MLVFTLLILKIFKIIVKVYTKLSRFFTLWTIIYRVWCFYLCLDTKYIYMQYIHLTVIWNHSQLFYQQF